MRNGMHSPTIKTVIVNFSHAEIHGGTRASLNGIVLDQTDRILIDI
jgi:hypothetical protein